MFFSIAFFCQQSWSGLIMTLPADIFPLSAVGSVSGLVGFGGAIGGAIFGIVAGFLLGRGFGYGTLFLSLEPFTLLGFLAILLLGGRLQRLDFRSPTNRVNYEDHRSAHARRTVEEQDDTVASSLLHQSDGSGDVP